MRRILFLVLALCSAPIALAQTCQTDADCTPSGNVCLPNSCNLTTHTCQQTAFNCNDNDPCTVNDRCYPGSDGFGNTVGKCEYDSYLCPPPTNPCQASSCSNHNGAPSCPTSNVTGVTDNNCVVEQCILSYGGASFHLVNVPDGTACGDGNACHQAGTCQAGVCSGATPVSCSGGAQCDAATGACTTSTVKPLFVNGDFAGNASVEPPLPWTLLVGSSYRGFSGQTPKTFSDLNLLLQSPAPLIDGTNIPICCSRPLTFVETAAGGPFSQPDPDIGSVLTWPRYGNQAVIVNQGSSGANVNVLSQTATVTSSNFDPADNKVHIRFAFAPVLQTVLGTNHDAYYFVLVTNVTQNTTLYRDFATAGSGNQPWQTFQGSYNAGLYYTPWQLASIAAGTPQINVGDSIQIQIVSTGGGDEYGTGQVGKIWIDGLASKIPGISVEGGAQATSYTSVNYTLTYHNDGSQTETNSTVTLTPPPNATYQALNAPFGVTCSTPAIGVAGPVACNVGILAPGQSNSIVVTLAFANGALGLLPFRNYGISSDQEALLLGPPISIAGLGATSPVYGPAAGSASDVVNVAANSSWTATSVTPWIHLIAAGGAGPGLATFTFDANAGDARTGTVDFSGALQQTLTVTQAGVNYSQVTQANTLVAAGAGLGSPQAVSADNSGNVYIADSANHSVESWNATNGFKTLFALSSATNPGNNLNPSGVAVDGSNTVYSSMSNGSAGRNVYAFFPATATAQGLSVPALSPSNIAADRAGNLFVATGQQFFEWSPSVGISFSQLDSSSNVLAAAVDLAGSAYESVQGTGVKKVAAPGQAALLFNPGADAHGLAVDGAGNVYTALPSLPAIVEWNPATQQSATLLSSGLTQPQGVAVDSAGDLFIADSGANAVYELPYAFVSTAAVAAPPTAGQAGLPPVLPSTAPVTASSDAAWLTVGSIQNGVVSYAFTANSTGAARTGHITIMGKTVSVTQAAPTLISNVSSTNANASYGIGKSVAVTVSFSQTVNVTGTPRLALNSGGAALYASGSGTSTLTFTYSVAAGQSSSRLDAASTAALTLNGGAIVDALGNPAVLALPVPGAPGSLGANKSIVIDTTAPTVVSFSVLFGSASFQLGSIPRFDLPWQITGIQVVFSKPVNATQAALTGVTPNAVAGSGTSTVTWTIAALSQASVSATVTGAGGNAVHDLAGNALATDFTQAFKVLWGDFNADGVVNSSDLVLVNNARSAAYNLFADMNGDGVVDTTDVTIVRANIGKQIQ